MFAGGTSHAKNEEPDGRKPMGEDQEPKARDWTRRRFVQSLEGGLGPDREGWGAM
jgi:hypothetical protein